jgi:hypothetical protein
MRKTSKKNWSIQISTELRDLLKQHCKRKGLKIGGFVEKTVRDSIPTETIFDEFSKIYDPHKKRSFTVRMDGVCPSSILRIERPGYLVKFNESGGIKQYVDPPVYQWKPIKIELYNFIDPEPNGFGSVAQQIHNLRSKTFDIFIEEMDCKCRVISQWRIIGARVMGYSYSELNRESDDFTIITMTLQYEYAEITFPTNEELSVLEK